MLDVRPPANEMLKLYKQTTDGVAYWEAWQDGHSITVHTGTVGQTGTARDVELGPSDLPDDEIRRLALAPRNEGYAELDFDLHSQLIVQYRLAEWGSVDDLDKRHRVEDILNECLGWTGNGHCDGGEIGSGTINAFAYVVDPRLAASTIRDALTRGGLIAGALIAIETEDGFDVIYPPTFEGTFSLG